MTGTLIEERTRAAGTIEVKTYNDTTYDEPGLGPALHRLSVTESFRGDIEGNGSVEFLQAIQPDGTASFVGLERVVGSLAGRRGSFVLQDRGTLEGKRVTGTWFVVPGSGTDELAGLRGEGGFTAELGQHAEITLDYWFE
ncbi:MAG: DUF3224 domain-containing protein [Chloroflexota bacterium]